MPVLTEDLDVLGAILMFFSHCISKFIMYFWYFRRNVSKNFKFRQRKKTSTQQGDVSFLSVPSEHHTLVNCVAYRAEASIPVTGQLCLVRSAHIGFNESCFGAVHK